MKANRVDLDKDIQEYCEAVLANEMSKFGTNREQALAYLNGVLMNHLANALHNEQMADIIIRMIQKKII